mgnify:CR=1 FL=1
MTDQETNMETAMTTETTAQEAPNLPEVDGFDFLRHADVQQMRRDGIFTYLGERFGGLEVRLRPFFEQPVVVRKEAAEAAIRMQLGLDDSDPLPGDKGLDVNKAAVTMAVTGARGRVKGNDVLLSIARRSGWEIQAGDWIVLNGSESAELIREFFSEMMDKSTHLLLTLVRASRALHKVKDSEVAAVGNAFVYGRHVKATWAD